jgi:hypothetical protein
MTYRKWVKTMTKRPSAVRNCVEGHILSREALGKGVLLQPPGPKRKGMV